MHLPLKVLWFFVAVFSFFVTAFTAPTGQAPPITVGSVISVKPTAFEDKKTAAGASIHPGVVVYISGGKYLIAMVSKNLPLNPPQAPIAQFKLGTTMYGNINLAFTGLKEVKLEDLRPWMGGDRLSYESPMTAEQLNNLREELLKNKNWKPAEGQELGAYVRKRKHQVFTGIGASSSGPPGVKHVNVPKASANQGDSRTAKKQRVDGDAQSSGPTHGIVSPVGIQQQRIIHPLPAKPKFAISAQ